MNLAERTELYATVTGLSRARTNDYRRRRVNDWSTSKDRKIGSTIRTLERVAHDDELTWTEWRRIVRELLSPIREFVEGIILTVRDLVDHVAHAVERVLSRVERLATSVGRAIGALHDLLKMIFA